MPTPLLQSDFFLQALTLTMIAYATFAHSPPESLLTAVSEHALLSLSKFEQQAIANLIWALALLHALTPNMWNQLLEAFSNVDDQQGMALHVITACHYCNIITADLVGPVAGFKAMQCGELESKPAGCRCSQHNLVEFTVVLHHCTEADNLVRLKYNF